MKSVPSARALQIKQRRPQIDIFARVVRGVGTFYSSYRWNAFFRHSHFVTSCCFSACIEVAHHHTLIAHGISFWIVFVPGSSNRNGLSTRGSSGRETVPDVASSSSALQGLVMWLGCRSVGDAGRLSYLLGSPGLRYLCMQPTSASGSSIPLLI